jgi:hypothetical protein
MMAAARSKSLATRRARARDRWERAQIASAVGMGKRAAARHLGLSAKGMNSLLRREVGSERWPITGPVSATAVRQ